MNRLSKILTLFAILGFFSILMSCFKVQHEVVRIGSMNLYVYDSTSYELCFEGDTCRFSNLEINVDLIPEHVASLSIPTFFTEAYAFQLKSYFDFTNRIEDLKITLYHNNKDSLEITSLCAFSFNRAEFFEPDKLIESMNNELNSYKDNPAEWANTQFNFRINKTDVNFIGYKQFAVTIKLTDGSVFGQTDFVHIID